MDLYRTSQTTTGIADQNKADEPNRDESGKSSDIVDELIELYRIAGQHIDTPVSDMRFTEVDAQLKGKIDQFAKTMDRFDRTVKQRICLLQNVALHCLVFARAWLKS